jgi:PAS domain S-box-containing protein
MQAEAQRNAGDAQYRAIFETASEAITIIDQGCNIVEANPAACRLYGYSYDELIGLHSTAVTHPDDYDLALYIPETLKSGGSIIQRARNVRKDGTVFHIEERATGLMYNGRPHILSVVRDISAQVEAEERLREQEEQYRAIFEATGDALIITDVHGTVVEANPACCRMYGYSRDEMIGRPANLREVVGTSAYQTRDINQRKDGSSFHLEGHATTFTYKGKPHLLGVVRDITARVEAEDALRVSEATNRALLAAIPDMMFRLTRDGVYLDVKADRYGNWALPAESIIGKHIREVLPEDVADEALRCVERTLQTGQMQIFEYALQADGTMRHFEARNVVSGPDEVLAIVRDVTDRVQAYELLEQRVEERTRELSTLLDVSHNVASTLELQPLLRLILAQIKPVVDYVEANITTLDGDRLTFLSYWGPQAGEAIVGRSFSLTRAASNRQVIESREPLIIADIWDDSPLAMSFRQVGAEDLDNTHLHFTAWMGVPLLYKDRVTGMLGLCHPQRGYYTAQHARLALALANQAAAAIENARLYARAQEAAALEERQRLARELHDSVSQALYGIALGARTAQTLLERDSRAVAEPLGYVLELAEAGLAEMRALIFELLPQALEREGLVAALQRQIAAVRARHRLSVVVSLGDEPDVHLEVKEALYRIAQEALHNTVKHAGARRIDIRLDDTGHALLLEVSDDGMGFDTAGTFPGHLGLQTMRERARRLGGIMEVTSTPGVGTVVRAKIGTTETR